MSNLQARGAYHAASQYFAARVGGNRPGLRPALTSLVPTGVFIAFDAWLGFVAAMIAASGITAALLIIRHRRGDGVGILLSISLAYVVMKGIAGVVTESEAVYFGVGLALTALLAITVGATALTQRPAASFALPIVTPYRHLKTDHPAYRRVSAQVTAVWALAELGITAWEAWHLTLVSGSGGGSDFVVARSVVAWPVMGVLIFFLVFYVRFRLDRYEQALASHVERRGGHAHHRWVDVADRPLDETLKKNLGMKGPT